VRPVPQRLDARGLVVDLGHAELLVDGVHGPLAAPAGLAAVQRRHQKAVLRQGVRHREVLGGSAPTRPAVDRHDRRVLLGGVKVRGEVQLAVQLVWPSAALYLNISTRFRPSCSKRDVSLLASSASTLPSTSSKRVEGGVSCVWITSMKCLPFGAMST